VPEYGCVPPEALTDTESDPPLHAIVPAVVVTDKADGLPMTADDVFIQPLPSVAIS